MLRRIAINSIVALVATVSVLGFRPEASSQAETAVTNPTPIGKVSFTFDDGYSSFITKAAPELAKYNMSATGYITTGFVGTTGYMNWDQVHQLQDQYGWEIGSHSVTHPEMTTLTEAQIEAEVSQSKAQLQAQGFNPTSYATPFGDYNDKVVASIAKYYSTHRPFHDVESVNTWPYNDYLLQVKQVQAGVTVAQVKQWVDQAKANNTWLVLVFHDITDTPSTDPEEYQYKTSELGEIAAYIKSQNVATSNISKSIVTSDMNLLPNASFQNGISEGWTADNTLVAADTSGRGSYDEATNSVKMTAGSTNVHLFSPRTTVKPGETYAIKSYINIVSYANGEVALYIDEYDANGNWISGQYKGALKSTQTKDLNVSYTTSSGSVASASLQFIVTANSGIVAYVDNVQWFQTTGQPTTEPNPNPNPTPVPPVPSTSLLDNFQFDNGIAGGWRTDYPSYVVADTNGNGYDKGTASDKMYSIHMTPDTTGAANVHLFSPQVTVDSAKTYNLATFVNMLNVGNDELAFYMDEYDANGNWISGQYIKNVRTVGKEDVTFTYKPTSANVAKASLQIIVVKNSGVNAYIDNVRWN